MNQQYLKGISSIMGSGESVIFPATEGNIISFLKMNQMAERSEIRTLDGKKFLTALKDAVIDICPDKAFLEDNIRPLLRRVKKGMEKVPKLQVIEAKVLDKYEPPMPDWNCLYWEGVSDEVYEELRSMKKPVMLEYEAFGKKYPIQVKVSSYLNNGNLAIQMYDWMEGYPELWATLTVNLWEMCEKDCSYVDTNNHGKKILDWIKKNNLGRVTGRECCSGYCRYPEVHFNEERLRELDPDGYEKYSEQFRHAAA